MCKTKKTARRQVLQQLAVKRIHSISVAVRKRARHYVHPVVNSIADAFALIMLRCDGR